MEGNAVIPYTRTAMALHWLIAVLVIVQVALGDLPHGSVGYQTIFAAGLMLMLLTLFFNLVGYWMRRRFRQAY